MFFIMLLNDNIKKIKLTEELSAKDYKIVNL